MRRSRTFVATTVLTLAIGIALVTLAFTVINAYFIRPPAVRDAHGLHHLAWRPRDAAGQSFRWPEYLELRDRRDIFATLVAESTRFVSSSGRPLAAAASCSPPPLQPPFILPVARRASIPS